MVSIESIERKLEALQNEGLENSKEYKDLLVQWDKLLEVDAQNQRQQQEFKKKAAEKRAAIKRMFDDEELDKVALIGQQEFGQDYEITQCMGAFSVLSHASSTNESNSNNWGPFKTLDKAEKKLRQLLYYRVYDFYVRSGDYDNVTNISY